MKKYFQERIQQDLDGVTQTPTQADISKVQCLLQSMGSLILVQGMSLLGEYIFSVDKSKWTC